MKVHLECILSYVGECPERNTSWRMTSDNQRFLGLFSPSVSFNHLV